MTTLTKKPLFAGVLRKELNKGAAPQSRNPGFSATERDSVRAAMKDGRDTRERTVDHVVDRMLNELTW